MKALIKRLKELEAKATKAPWSKYNGSLLAIETRNALPKLLDYIEELTLNLALAKQIGILTDGIKDGAVANVNENRALKKRIEKLEAENEQLKIDLEKQRNWKEQNMTALLMRGDDETM